MPFRRAFTGGIAAVAVIALTGCSPVLPAALRVNFDGSLDYASCSTDDHDWHADAYAFGDDVGAGRAAEIVATDALMPTVAGRVVHFERPADAWSAIAVGASRFTEVQVDSDDVSLGRWIWNTGDEAQYKCAIGG